MEKQSCKSTNLGKILRYGEKPEPDLFYFLSGYFDEEKNYVFEDEYPERLYPWEWILIPEIVRYAEHQGVEVPRDPPVDSSKFF